MKSGLFIVALMTFVFNSVPDVVRDPLVCDLFCDYLHIYCFPKSSLNKLIIFMFSVCSGHLLERMSIFKEIE